MKPKPSEYFIGAILRAYYEEIRHGRRVTPSSLWDGIVNECLRRQNGFVAMFEWDTSKAKNRNRIDTIIEMIEAGLVPGLALTRDGKGLAVVNESKMKHGTE